MSEGMIPFPDKFYQTILADPPWQYKDKANAGERGACHKYSTMSIEEICALPVGDIATDDCVLFLWVTAPFLPQAFKVAESWGFTYKTKAFTWIKYTEKGKLFWGMGRWTRANSEDCLLFVRGNPKPISHNVHQIIRGRILNHSVKPPETRDRIVRLIGDVSRIELFARQRCDGWDAYGDEI